MTTAMLCHICDNVLQDPDVGSCQRCYRDFHIGTMQQSMVQDCGVIFLNPSSLGLVFLCLECARDAEDTLEPMS
jgi:hypothetical protein